ncbi:MAG: alkaline phosphatase family protein, partial [Burkholderiales bacterium]
MPRPADYSGNGFVNLIASLVEARGGAPRHAPLVALAAAEIRNATNIVLLIVDGLGDNYLRAHGAGGPLLKHRRAGISAVFPSTTASAITTSYTGATPLEHGLTGWYTYFSAPACVAAALPFQRRGEKALLEVRPDSIYLERSLFDSLATRSIVVSYRPIIDSQYNRHHCGGAERRAYDNIQGLVDETVNAVKSGADRKFVYSYWPRFDVLAHKH